MEFCILNVEKFERSVRLTIYNNSKGTTCSYKTSCITVPLIWKHGFLPSNKLCFYYMLGIVLSAVDTIKIQSTSQETYCLAEEKNDIKE